MNIWAWLVIGWMALGSFLIVANVGKRREPTSGPAAAVALVIQAGLVWCVILAATN